MSYLPQTHLTNRAIENAEKTMAMGIDAKVARVAKLTSELKPILDGQFQASSDPDFNEAPLATLDLLALIELHFLARMGAKHRSFRHLKIITTKRIFEYRVLTGQGLSNKDLSLLADLLRNFKETRHEALAIYNRLIERSYRTDHHRIIRLQTLIGMKRFDEAIHDSQELIEQQPDNIEWYHILITARTAAMYAPANKRGQYHFAGKRNQDDFMDLMSQAIHLENADFMIFNTYLRLHLDYKERKSFDQEALDFFSSIAEKMEPLINGLNDKRQYHSRVAQIAYYRGLTEKASHHFERANLGENIPKKSPMAKLKRQIDIALKVEAKLKRNGWDVPKEVDHDLPEWQRHRADQGHFRYDSGDNRDYDQDGW